MITLHFVYRWAGLAGLTLLALVIEHGVITTFWWFALAAALTLLAFVGITAGMFREWRAHAGGSYHYRVTGKRDRIGGPR